MQTPSDTESCKSDDTTTSLFSNYSEFAKHIKSQRVQQSSSTATINVLLNSTHKTVREFRPKRASFSQKSASVFAMKLMSLWINQPNHEHGNYIPIYKVDKISGIELVSFNPNTHAFHEYAYSYIKKYFHDGSVQNLGALSFLNIFMEGTFDISKLAVTLSGNEGTPFFTQTISNFWTEYFSKFNSKAEIMGDNLLGFSNKDNQHKSWWIGLLGQNAADIRALYLNEIFLIVLKIYVTPDILIQDLGQNILGVSEKSEMFINYLIDKKDVIIRDFKSSLSDAEIDLWTKFVEESGSVCFLDYERDLDHFRADHTVNIDVNKRMMQYFNMFMRAVDIGLPNLYFSKLIGFNNKRTATDKAYLISNILDLFMSNWVFLSKYSEHALWYFTDKLCKNLHKELTLAGHTIYLEDGASDFLFVLLMQTIKLYLNNFGIFLLQHFPLLSSMKITHLPYLLAEDRKFLSHSIGFYAQKLGNKEMDIFIGEDNPHNKLDNNDDSKSLKAIESATSDRVISKSSTISKHLGGIYEDREIIKSQSINSNLCDKGAQKAKRRERSRSFDSERPLEAKYNYPSII